MEGALGTGSHGDICFHFDVISIGVFEKPSANDFWSAEVLQWRCGHCIVLFSWRVLTWPSSHVDQAGDPSGGHCVLPGTA